MIRLGSHPRTDFIDNRLQMVDPVFQTLPPVLYNHTSCAYLPSGRILRSVVPHDEAMKRQEERFRVAVRAYEKSYDGGASAIFKESEVTSWNDVLQQVQLAQESYRGAARKDKKGIKGEIRGLLRNFSQATTPVETWMKLLPAESWQGSFICGGVSIVLQAASRLDVMREDTYSVLEDIPTTIEMSYSWIQLYFDSERTDMLEYFVSQLFVEILKFLQHTVTWYAENPLKKVAKTVFLGDDYGKEMAQIRQRMGTLRNKAKEEVDMNRDLRIQQIAMDQPALAAMMLNRMSQLFGDGEQRNQNLIEQLLAERREDRARHEKQKAEWEEKERIAQARVDEERRFRLKERREYLLRCLRHDRDSNFLDLKELFIVGQSLPLEAHDRAAWIVRAPKVASWLAQSSSQLLIINGNESQHERQSAVSYFTAITLQTILRERLGTVTLFWLCGQQSNAPSASIMSSLVCQLVEQCSLDVSVPDPSDIDEFSDFQQLLACFRTLLLAQLEFSNVFVVLDSISFYEDRRHRRELRALIQELVQTSMEAQNSQHWLKTIATSPTRCDCSASIIRQRSPICNVLEVPEFIDGDLHSLNHMDFTRHVESAIQPRQL